MPYSVGQLLPSASTKFLSQHKELLNFIPYFNWKIPRHGLQRDGCGSISKEKIIGCKKHYKLQHKVIVYSCFRPQCPICGRKWALREARNATDRILHSLQCLKGSGIKTHSIRHIVFSPPQVFAKEIISTLEGFRKLRSKAIKLAKKCGLYAGCVVFHAHRFDKHNKEWYISPHFHFLGLGYLQPSDKFYEKTGWIYMNYKKRKTLLGTIFYELTHCGLWVENNKVKHHTVIWFGEFAYNILRVVKKEKKYFPIKCKICKKPFFEIKNGFEVNEKKIGTSEIENTVIFTSKPEFGRIYYNQIVVKTYSYKNKIYGDFQTEIGLNGEYG